MAGTAMTDSGLTKVLLDTDIGDNIDDALCLAYLLAQPACSLTGVTTVTERADRQALLVRDICAAAGASPPQAPSGREAADLMHRLVRAHPGEIELLAIGPLSNVALLLRVYPEVPGLLRGVTLMCGTHARGKVGPESPERNARSDPAATAAVYSASLRRCRSVGLNVTRRVTVGADELARMLSCESFELVRALAEAWFADRSSDGSQGATRERAALNDPLAAVTLFDSDVCSFEPGVIEVAVDSGHASGATIWRPGGPTSPHEVATDVDPEACVRHIQATFAAARSDSGEDR